MSEKLPPLSEGIRLYKQLDELPPPPPPAEVTKPPRLRRRRKRPGRLVQDLLDELLVALRYYVRTEKEGAYWIWYYTARALTHHNRREDVHEWRVDFARRVVDTAVKGRNGIVDLLLKYLATLQSSGASDEEVRALREKIEEILKDV